jgi:hypothetical protein
MYTEEKGGVVMGDLQGVQGQGVELQGGAMRGPRAVEAPLNYLNDVRTMSITDARTCEQSPTLDREGFTLRAHRSAVTDFADRRQIDDVYMREMEAFIAEVTGAAKVLAYPTYVRRFTGKNVVNGDKRTLNAGRAVHIDFDDPGAREHLAVVADVNSMLRAYKRVQIIQSWQAFSGGFQDIPLAVCDGRTVAERDLVLARLLTSPELGPVIDFNYYMSKYSPAHRWYYYSAMQPDEVLLFQGHNFNPGDRKLVMHTAFEDPSCPPDAPPRESIEARFFVFHHD